MLGPVASAAMHEATMRREVRGDMIVRLDEGEGRGRFQWDAATRAIV
jgi:hypothetical protein